MGDAAMWPSCDMREAAGMLRAGTISAAELVDDHLARIERLDGDLNACITVLADDARRDARRADRRDRGAGASDLLGLPFAVKDNFEMAGVRSTCGSPRLADHVPTRDSAAVQRLRAAGVAFVAKVNLDEFAFGGDSANPVGGATHNPWDYDSVPGGSSGGSAAAVAAGMCMGALGSDTGGSIRNPSAWCGVAGLKPTFGAIDPAGVIPLAWSLDTVGYLARTCADLALLYAETADRFTGSPPEARRSFVDSVVDGPVRRPRIGVVQDLLDRSEPEARAPLQHAVGQLGSVGDVGEVALPRVDDALAAFLTIMMAEGSAAWESGLRHGWERFGPPVRALLDAGRLIRATEYLHAQRVREGVRREVHALFDDFDALVMPCMGIAPRPDPFPPGLSGLDNPIWRLAVQYTSIWNLTGSPVVCVPCGFTDRGRPVAMQIVTPPGTEATGLEIGTLAEATWAIPRSALVPTWVQEQLAGTPPSERPDR